MSDRYAGDRRPKTVLLVDDDAQFLALAQELLRYLGYEALVAAEGQQALEIFRQQPIDLVILDVQLPRLDGYQLLKQLQDLVPEVKVMVSSGFLAQAEMDRFQQAGAAGIIHKPFRAGQLHTEIVRILGE